MDENTKLLFFVFLISLIIPTCLTDMTGAHYLRTINCSLPSLYIPQGPYLFNHHWPFISISVQYQDQITRGTCYRDGSLYFTLSNDKLCSGIYYRGQAKLLCRYENDDYCVIEMKTTDDSRLTCDGSKIQSMTIGLIGIFSFIIMIYKNHLFD